MATRRTHVVRVHAPPNSPPDGANLPYVDIEVLDAIGFIGPNGTPMVINMPTDKITPNINDDTGGDNQVSNGPGATRLSHMTRIEGTVGGGSAGFPFKFDVECIDAISCTDDNGSTWILDMPQDDSSAFCTTDQGGDDNGTRQTHLEVLYAEGATKAGSSCNPVSLTIERPDYLGFTSENGDIMIVAAPSNDDKDTNPSIARASTFMTPNDYDPTDRSKVPPNIEDNQDPNLYFKFVKQKIPAVPPVTTIIYHITGTFYGYAPTDQQTHGLQAGDQFIPDLSQPGYSYGLGWVTTHWDFGGSSSQAAAYARSFIGQAVGALNGTGYAQHPTVIGGNIVNIWFTCAVSGSTSSTVQGTPARETYYKLGTDDGTTGPPNVPPSSTDPKKVATNVKMGPMWWLRKWSNNGDPPK